MPRTTDTAEAVRKIKDRMAERTLSVKELAVGAGVSEDGLQAALSGKAILDNDSLLRIGKSLGLEPEELMLAETGNAEEDSPYFKAVAGGMLGVKRLEGERDQVNIVDNTGKYFIEYAVDARDNKVFEYMLSSRALPLYPSPNKARALLRIATGCLRCKLNPENYLDSFFQEAGKDSFSGAPAEEFLVELEKYKRTDIFQKVLGHRISVSQKVLGPISKTKSYPLLSPEKALELVGKLRLTGLLAHLFPLLPDPKAACYLLANCGFLTGLTSALDALERTDPLLPTAIEQRCAMEALKEGRQETLEAMIERGHTDTERLLLFAIAVGNQTAAVFLSSFVEGAVAERMAIRAAEYDRFLALRALEKRFSPTPDFYTAAFAVAAAEAAALQRYLIDRGARFTPETLYAPQKANQLVTSFQKEKTL